ncbi:Peptidoglycan glycosyltransferase [Ketogulonicigenium robustum]|uniref:Peptidoglycan glycosyltransferase n=1 Tax=Ketogulonicigenium robustum TaxID=92947 RepID=A0A1W6NY40_9RHOB|nr:penicillin-binding protein 2 [Ketogulonicigenium robustum]ARO13937.1 Peptidoglycan glycosyltransferase [Ketogulonicigenium robustum]
MIQGQRDTTERGPRFTRRALLLSAAQVGVMGLLGWRMHQLQVDKADQFRLLAEENRISVQLIPPARGLIFDINGVALATNEPVYRIVIVRENAGDVEDVLNRLARIITLTPEDIARTREEVARRPAFLPVTVIERITWDEVARVHVNAPALPGISAEVGLSRVYPHGQDTAHVVGYVGPVSEYDLSLISEPDPILQIPRFQIGKTGVENKLENAMRGTAGTRRIEVNALGRVMRELDRQEGDSGADIQLTLDSKLQAYVEARLDGESAACVVMDCETGDLRAIGSAPSFDPNLFVRGISVPDWTGLNENMYRPLAAKAFQGTYPPGSTFKAVTALAAMEAGVLTPEETIYCRGFVEVSGTRFHCWRAGGHGNVNFNDSLKFSCDCYYYEVSQRVGIDAMAAMARKMGIGVRHDLPLSAVASGLAPDRQWKREVRGEEWRIGDTVNASIGQGYVLASPLQLAVMTARLATGRNVEPRLIHAVDGVVQPIIGGESLGLNENFLRRTRQSMFDVVNHQRGTAYGTRFDIDGVKMAGKTGTSQVRRITPEERARGVTSNDQLPWERRDHALWIDFAPFDAPKYAVAVVVEHGGGGGSVAGPIGRDVTMQALAGGFPAPEAYPAATRGRATEIQDRVRNLLQERGRIEAGA